MKIRLIKYDFVQIKNDPMLILSTLTPVFLFLFIAFLFSPANEFVESEFSYDLNQWYFQIICFLTAIIPMVFGMTYSFILIDEKDAGIITAISITPFGRKGYLILRIGFPFFVSFISTSIFSIVFGMPGGFYLSKMMVHSFLLALNIPLILLFIGTFASNKVEGIALSKSFGILLAGMVLDFFASGSFKWFGAFSPLFWIERFYFSTGLKDLLFFGLFSMLFYGVLIMLLYRRFILNSN